MKKLFILVSLIFLTLPFLVFSDIEFKSPLKAKTFSELINNIANLVFYIAIALVPVTVVIGAIKLITSGGDEKEIKEGKNIIRYSIIGLLIALLSKAIIAIIIQTLGG